MGGTKHKECTACHEVLSTIQLDPTGHDYQDGACSVCGEPDPDATKPDEQDPADTVVASEGLEFSEIYDTDGVTVVAYAVSGIGTCTDTDIVIPAEHNGKPVTTLGYHALFDRDEELTSVRIPEGVTTIEDFACGQLKKLREFYLPSTLVTIEDEAARFYSTLEKIVVAESNPVFSSQGNCLIVKATKTLMLGCKNTIIPTDGSVEIIGDGAFYEMGITSIAIPSSVTRLGKAAFYGNSELTNITLPEGLLQIDSSAFLGTGLENITIPANVTSIGYWVFDDCSSLTIYCEASSKPAGWTNSWNCGCTVVWDCNNTTAPASEGLEFSEIYDTDGVTVVAYAVSGIGTCTDTDIVIPAEHNGKPVTEITEDFSGFSDLDNVEKITLPQTVVSLERYALIFENPVRYIVSGQNPAFAAVDGSLYSKDGKTLWRYAGSKTETTATVPNGVTTLAFGAFANGSLFAVTIPSSVQTIEEEAIFSECSDYFVIYCEAAQEPAGWGYCWHNHSPVVWDCNNNSVATDGKIYAIQDNLFYIVENGEATVMAAGYYATSVDIANKVTVGGNEYPVTAIATNAFYKHKYLLSVRIPDSVTSVGMNAVGGGVEIVYCQAASLPEGWHGVWNHSNAIIVLDCDNNEVGMGGIIPFVKDGLLYCLSENSALESRVWGYDKTITVANISSTITYKGKTYTIKSIWRIDECTNLQTIVVPESVYLISCRFCDKLQSATFENPNNWYCYSTGCELIYSGNLSDPAAAAEILKTGREFERVDE